MGPGGRARASGGAAAGGAEENAGSTARGPGVGAAPHARGSRAARGSWLALLGVGDGPRVLLLFCAFDLKEADKELPTCSSPPWVISCMAGFTSAAPAPHWY